MTAAPDKIVPMDNELTIGELKRAELERAAEA